MNDEPYDGWLFRMAQRFQDAFGEIEPEFAFDHGPETEIAFCKVFRRLFPARFSVCRGFAVSRDGTKAGDDIIIFDSYCFPTLRALGDDLSKKEEVPIEAVVGYVEVKHTLRASSDNNGGQSLQKALEQVAKVKALPRPKVSTTLEMSGFVSRPLTPVGYPDYRNPIYTAIAARHIDLGKESIEAYLLPTLLNSPAVPDLLVAGNVLAVPGIRRKDGGFNASLFREVSDAPLVLPDVKHAFGAAIVHMLWAFEWIQLGPFPWPEVFLSAVRGAPIYLPVDSGKGNGGSSEGGGSGEAKR